MKYVVGICVGFGVLFLIVCGSIPLWMGVRDAWRGFASSGWPVAEAVVSKAEIATTDADRKEGAYTLESYTFYLPRLSFRYQVNGKSYTTENLQFGCAVGSGDPSEAVLLMLRYPVGAKVMVRYNPGDPPLAVARSGVHSDIAWYFVAGIVFILFGGVAGLAYIALITKNVSMTRGIGLMWIAFIMFGIGMLTPGLVNLWRAKASVNWPTAKGAVVFSEERKDEAALQDSGGNLYGSPMRGVPLAYRYEVNGEKHYSNVRHFGQFVRSSDESWSQFILKRYPTGAQVPVTYCPTDPDVAALEPGINSEAWFLPGGGAAFLLFGILALYFSLRRR